MRSDGEVDLVNTMRTIQEHETELAATKLALKELTEAAQPIADMVEPPAEDVEPPFGGSTQRGAYQDHQLYPEDGGVNLEAAVGNGELLLPAS